MGKLIISPSVPTIKCAGEIFSLVCSADIYPLLINGSLSIFEWFFDNTTVPSGVTVSNVMKRGNTTYTSTLQFSPLLIIHSGMYTCRIGYKTVNTTVFVMGKDSYLWLVQIVTRRK